MSDSPERTRHIPLPTRLGQTSSIFCFYAIGPLIASKSYAHPSILRVHANHTRGRHGQWSRKRVDVTACRERRHRTIDVRRQSPGRRFPYSCDHRVVAQLVARSTRMNELGKRRSEIIRFLGGLTDREKLIALAYLANDQMISARIPGLANTIMDMHRAHHRSALLKSVGAKSCTIDLEL